MLIEKKYWMNHVSLKLHGNDSALAANFKISKTILLIYNKREEMDTTPYVIIIGGLIHIYSMVYTKLYIT